MGGGHNLQGYYGNGKAYGFNTWGSPRPEAIPIVTESTPSHHTEHGAADSWHVYATAPRAVTGKWWLQAWAVCG